MDKCKGFLGRLRCNFEARYDEKIADHRMTSIPAPWAEDIIQASKVNTYVHDICTACGEVRKRT